MTPWKDPNVKAALKTRQPSDISLICCPECGNYGYYNDGSHFTCPDSECNFSMSGGELDRALDNGEVITLDDYTDMQAMDDEEVIS